MIGTLTAAGNSVPFNRVPPTALSLLRTARQGLAEADAETDPGTRYICAHLAALRAAAAIVAAGESLEAGAAAGDRGRCGSCCHRLSLP